MSKKTKLKLDLHFCSRCSEPIVSEKAVLLEALDALDAAGYSAGDDARIKLREAIESMPSYTTDNHAIRT